MDALATPSLAAENTGRGPGASGPAAGQFLAVSVLDQWLGLPVSEVRDVLRTARLTTIPAASPAIAGIMNLRGRVVTAIDLRRRLGLPPAAADTRPFNVVVDREGESYGLVVDRIGDVLSLAGSEIEAVPDNLDSVWRSMASGIHRMANGLLLTVDIGRLLDLDDARLRVRPF